MSHPRDHPPRWIGQTFRRLFPGNRGAEALEDLDREYAVISGRYSRAVAWGWYVAQLLRRDTWRLARSLRRLRETDIGFIRTSSFMTLRSFRAGERTARELRRSLRALSRSPAFTTTAVLILGLGIGLATAMFTIVEAVLLRPLPVADAAHLVLPRTLDPGGVDVGMTQDELRQLSSASRTFGEIAGVAHQGAAVQSIRHGERILRMRSAWVTGNFFEVLGVTPVLGRLFSTRDEATPGSAPIVLSYDAWRRHFGGDSTVIGKRLGNPYTREESEIIGVAPAGLSYPAGTELWKPVVYSILNAVARLEPGASLDVARSEFLSIMREIDRQRVAENRQGASIARAEIQTFREAVLGDVRAQIFVLTAGVTLLLLIACVNVGNLVLLRATKQQGEIAIRRSLGAGTADIVRPLVWESAALAVGGGVVSLVCAAALLRLVTRLSPPEMPRLDVLRLSTAPLEIAGGVTLVVLLLSGVVPALLAARGSLAAPLRLDARSGRAGSGRRRLRKGLVASQIALAVIMVAGAGLLVRTLDRLTSIDLGYRPEHLSIITLVRQVTPDSGQAQISATYERVAPALRALPAVIAITPVDAGPFYGPQVFVGRWATTGQSDADASSNPLIPFEVGGSEYFRTFDIPLLRGRGFLETDVESSPRVAVVSRSVAQRFWPGENPVGKQLRLAWDTSANPWLTVVGEAGDIRYRTLREATPSIYVPWRQMFFQGIVAIRTSAPLEQLLAQLRNTVRRADPEASIADAVPMEAMVAEQLALSRLSTTLVSGFGLSALLLAAMGLFGVMAATVRERTHELGVRAALGATPAQLRQAVMVQAAAIAAVGIVAGLGGALITSRFLRSLLFEVSPIDPLALLAAGFLLLGVALVASLVPAWRATRADPMGALRAD